MQAMSACRWRRARRLGPRSGSGGGGTAEVKVAVAIPDARLWSPEQPHLYTAAIALP